MADFELADLGDGRFGLSGDVSFHTAETILKKSEKLFASHQNVSINLADVTHTDSAGLALLLEWISQSENRDRGISFEQVPEKIQAIAVTAEIDSLLNRDYSVSSSNSSSSKK